MLDNMDSSVIQQELMRATVSVREFARTYDCTVKYVYDLLTADKIEGAEKVDGVWRIPRATLKELMRQREERDGKGST